MTTTQEKLVKMWNNLEKTVKNIKKPGKIIKDIENSSKMSKNAEKTVKNMKKTGEKSQKCQKTCKKK